MSSEDSVKEDLTNDYSVKFATMIMQIPNTMYIFEVTKPCGYGEFVLIYKDMMVSEMIKVVATQFQDPSIQTLLFANKHVISLADTIAVRQLIQSMQLTTIYPGMEKFVVYRVFTDSINTLETTAEVATMTSCHENDCFSILSSLSES